MSRAGNLIAQYERITLIKFDFDRDRTLNAQGRKLPHEIQADMEKADKVELRNHGQELMGYVGSKPVFVAGGYYEEDDGEFVIESYYSKAFMSSNGIRFEKNTVNPEMFAR